MANELTTETKLERALSLLKSSGFTSTELNSIDGEEFDVKTVSGSYKTRIKELHQNDGEHIDKITSDAKLKGLAEAYNKAKKAINATFGLGLNNKDLDEIDVTDLVTKAQGSKTATGNEEVDALTAKLFEANSKLKEFEEKYDTDIKKANAEKVFAINQIKAQNFLLSSLGTEKYIIPQDDAADMFHSKLAKDGLTLKVETDGAGKEVVNIYKGDHKAQKADGTGYETLTTLRDKYLDPFKEKGNGSGGDGNPLRTTDPNPETKILNPTLQKQIEIENSKRAVAATA